MTAAQAYGQLVAALSDHDGVSAGQMFGKVCLKVAGKAFVAQHLDAVVFKLSGEAHADALALSGAKLWDPSGKGRPMKEWVALPAKHEARFRGLADRALEYVAGPG